MQRPPYLLLTLILLSLLPGRSLAQDPGAPDPLARDLLRAIQWADASVCPGGKIW